MNRFQCVADLQRRYGVKRLCSILGAAQAYGRGCDRKLDDATEALK